MSTDKGGLAVTLEMREGRVRVPRIVRISLPFGILASLLGALAQPFVGPAGKPISDLWITIGFFLGISAVFGIAWKYMLGIEEGKHYPDLDHLHRIQQDLCEGMVRLSNARTLTRKDYLDLEHKIVQSSAANVEKLFRKMIEAECKVSVKLIYEEGNRRFAKVFVRSLEPCPRDEEFETPAIVGNGTNTGLDRALERRNHGVSYFFCNNLKALQENEEYENHRLGWDKLYNATIVVPICSGNPETSLGFLCVDTLKADAFDRDSQISILAMVARILYIYFRVFRQYAPKEGEELGKTKTLLKSEIISEGGT